MDIREEIKRETNPEILRQMAGWILEDNDRLRALNAEIEARKAREAQLQADFRDKLTVLRKVIFGTSSERRQKDVADRPRATDSSDLLVFAQSMLAPPKKEMALPLPEDSVEHDATGDQLVSLAADAGVAGTQGPDFEEIKGLFDESTEITVIERVYKKLRHRRKKYRYKPGRPNGGELIVTAPGPAKLIPGAGYSIDFAVQAAADKYLYHTPLSRQAREMDALGLKGVQEKTLYNLCYATAVHLVPMTEKIRQEIFNANLAVHVDETPWPINNSKEDDGYMWIASNQAGALYRFEPTRSGKIAEEILEGFCGAVVTDGFAGYNRLENIAGITLASCWAHARRKFFEIRENYPNECEPLLDWIDELFAIERAAQDFDGLAELRRTRAGPIIVALHARLLDLHVGARNQGGLHRAVEYCLKRWTGLTRFLANSKIPLSNNDAERALRGAVMGRKNFHGSRTINGADTAAIFYTVVESCKKVELDPKSFIAMAVRESASGRTPPTPLEYARATRQ